MMLLGLDISFLKYLVLLGHQLKAGKLHAVCSAGSVHLNTRFCLPGIPDPHVHGV